MKRLLAAAALAAFGVLGPATPASAICVGSAVCAADGCTGTVNVCGSDECSGYISVCPFADPEDCHSSFDVCPGINITPTICIPCVFDDDDGTS